MSTTLEVTPIPAFDDNYIWLLCTPNGNAAVVDPGDAQPVNAYLKSHGLTLKQILITHHHYDHTGGIGALIADWQCEVIGPQNPSIEAVSKRVTEGDQVTVLGQPFDVLEVPGHTLDHIAYYRDDILFCGDTLFAGGCGRVFEGTHPQMRQSLAKLRALPTNTRVFCAHEYTLSNLRFALAADPNNAELKARFDRCESLRAANQPTVPSTLAEEQATNPFLRWDAQSLITDLSAQQTLIGNDGDGVFQTLREWKDRF